MITHKTIELSLRLVYDVKQISCGFLINVCMEYFIPVAFIISFLPTAIMFLASQVRHKND